MPYASQAQAAYFNIHRKEMEAQGVDVDHWNAASKGMHLPKRVKPMTDRERIAHALAKEK